LSDFYHDDPVEEVSGTRRNFKGIISLILVIAVGGTYLQTTLAANISLNSGLVVNFGQGVAATTACSGGTSLIVTPISSFQNVSGAGAFYFSSVKVSNIPTSCNGKDFIINAYNTSSNTPLAIFNTSSTNAVVYNNAGTFELGIGTTTGASITSASGTFTLTFTTPVATATSVFKLTIQSSNHAEITGAYSIGSTGPGGGIIFYYSAAGFNCGPTYSATGSPTGGKCNYLEVAPSIWSGLYELDENDQPTGVPDKDSRFPFAIPAKVNQNVVGISDYSAPDGNGVMVSQIGIGYQNSQAIITQGNGATTAAGAARAYTGGSKTDWYLPSFSELNLLCQRVKGIAQDATRACNSSAQPTLIASGFEFLWNPDPAVSAVYSSSSEQGPDENSLFPWAWGINFASGQIDDTAKGTGYPVRPIRAF